jgi:hypothetical protein
MKTLIIIGIVLTIAGFTNPTRDQHVSEVKGIIVSNVLTKSVGHLTSRNQDHKPVSVLGTTLGTVAIREMADTFVSIDDYIVLSLTRITHHDQSQVVGIGAFGKVWISDDVSEGVSALVAGE